MKYITRLPFEGSFKVTYPYNVINNNYPSGRHDGIDLVGLDNVNVYSICYGKVSYVGYENVNNIKQGFGLYISIKFDVTNSGYKKVFLAHLKSTNVTLGQSVSPATIIGIMGNTGMSTGPHTHVEIREYDLNNNLLRKLNPAKYMGIPNVVGVYNSINYRTYLQSYSTGRYKVNTPRGVNVRTGPGTDYSIKKINELTFDARKRGGYINGTIFDVFEVKNNWGRTPSGWVCLDYAIKI